MPASVALGPHFERFVREQVESGRYGNVSEVVQAGLRLLEESDRRQDIMLGALRADVAAGLSSGPGHPAGPAFDRLRAKYAQLAAEKCS